MTVVAPAVPSEVRATNKPDTKPGSLRNKPELKMASFEASVALMNLQPVASDEASLDADTLTPAVDADTFTVEGTLLYSGGSHAGLPDNQKVFGATAPVDFNQDADSKQFSSDQESNGDGAPAAGAPAGVPTDGANAPAPAPGGAPAGAGGLDGGGLPSGNPGGAPVEMSGNGGREQGNGGGAGGAGVWDDEDLNEVDFMARAHERFLLASPPIPSVCSVQEAARITVEMINAHGGVGDGLGFGAAAAATAAPLTLGSIVAAAATGLRAAGAPAIGVSPEAPVEPTINLVFNEPAPGSTSVAASPAPAPSPSAGKPTRKGAQAAHQPILTAVATTSPSSFAPTGAVGPSKKTQTLAAEDEAKRIIAERLMLELIEEEEEAEKVKRGKASKKHEKKKAAKAAKKAGAAGAHAEEVENTADSSSVGPSSSVAAAVPEPIAPIPERQPPAQQLVAKPAPPAEPERAVPKTVQVAKAVVQQHASAPAPIPAPATATPEPPAVPPKKESKKKAKEHAPTATVMATASGAGLNTSAGATTSAAVCPATPLVETKVVTAVPRKLAAAAAPVTVAAPLPAVATTTALVQASVAAPAPAAVDSAPHFNRTLALLNPALAAAAAARAGGLLPTAVRPVMSTAGNVTRTLPGVPIIRAAAPEASGAVPPPPPIPSYAGTAPAPLAAPIYRPAYPHPIQATVAVQTAVPISGTPAFTRPIPVVQAGPFMALSSVAPHPVVRTVQQGGAQLPVQVAAVSAAPAAGPRPTNPMAAAFMAYRSTTVTAAAAAAPAAAPVPLAAPRYVDDDEHLCVVCMEKNRSILLMPCGHLVLCGSCLPAIVDKGNLCPICRESIQQTCHMGQ